MPEEAGIIKKFQLTFKITIIFILSILFIGISYFYITPEYINYQSNLKFMILLAGGMATIYSAFYIGLTLRENIKRDKIIKALELGDVLGANFMEIRQKIETEINHKEMSPVDISNKIFGDKKLLLDVRILLNALEKISIAIQQDYICEETIYIYLNFTIPNIYLKYSSFIDSFRKKNNDEYLYYEYEKLVKSWKNNKYLSSELKLKDLK